MLSLTFERLSRLHLHSEAKVCEFDFHLVVQKDVLRLQVPVDDVLAVEKLHHLQQSAHDVPKKPTHAHTKLLKKVFKRSG